MNWQLPIVAIIVAAAFVYLVRQTWAAWTKRRGCGTGCACGDSTANRPKLKADTTIIPVDELRIRSREPR
jgi:hypothetical protein